MSSEQTGNSTPWADIVAFGRRLIKDLRTGGESSLLAGWMAHYLAEQLTAAEMAKGSDRAAIRMDCYETILKLWQHRQSLPGGRRPLEDFEPILATISSLGNNKGHWFFDPARVVQGKDPGGWLKSAVYVDTGAKSIIKWCIMMSTLHAQKSEARWLKGMPLDGSNDLKAIASLQALANAYTRAGTSVEQERSKDIRQIIERLKALELASRSIRKQASSLLKKGRAPKAR